MGPVQFILATGKAPGGEWIKVVKALEPPGKAAVPGVFMQGTSIGQALNCACLICFAGASYSKRTQWGMLQHIQGRVHKSDNAGLKKETVADSSLGWPCFSHAAADALCNYAQLSNGYWLLGASLQE